MAERSDSKQPTNHPPRGQGKSGAAPKANDSGKYTRFAALLRKEIQQSTIKFSAMLKSAWQRGISS